MQVEALRGRKTYDLKRFESIGHGEIGHVGWDLVPLAEKLKVSSEKAVEIHLRESLSERLIGRERDSDKENKMFCDLLIKSEDKTVFISSITKRCQ